MLDLPMGGLLSELLASEGVDPEAIVGPGEEEPAAVQPTAVRPAVTLPAAIQMDQQAGAPAEPPVEHVALPGLFADLMNLAVAASDEVVPAPVVRSEGIAAPEEAAVPEAAVPEAGLTAAAARESEEPAFAVALPGLLAELEAEAEGTQVTESAITLALPELLAELEAEDARTEEIAGGAEAVAPAAEELRAFTPAPDLDLVEVPEDSDCDAAAIEALKDAPAAAASAEPSPAAAEAIEQPRVEVSIAPESETEPESERVPASEAASWNAAGVILPPDVPEEAVRQDPDGTDGYDTAAAAAALAHAASEIIGAMEEPSGKVRLIELAALVDEIDREIAASTADGSTEPAPGDENLERYVVFRLGGNSYGLHMEAVREVEKVGRVTAVPGAPPLLCGLINLRGEILPLVDPKPALGLEPARGTPSGYLVVVQAIEEDPPVALMVDELGGVALVDPQELALQLDHDDAGSPGGGRMRGSTQHRGRSVELLDHRRLFTAEALLEQVEG